MLNALAAAAATPRRFEVTGLHAAPLFHVGGISFVVQLGMRLGTHVLVPSFDAAEILRLIEIEHIVETFMVPTMIRRLIDEPGIAHGDLSSLKTVLYGSQRTSARAKSSFEAICRSRLRANCKKMRFANRIGLPKTAASVNFSRLFNRSIDNSLRSGKVPEK